MRGSVPARHAYCLVSVAEDAGFELARRCHQHVFQVCGRVCAEARDRTYLGDLNPAGALRMCLNAGE